MIYLHRSMFYQIMCYVKPLLITSVFFLKPLSVQTVRGNTFSQNCTGENCSNFEGKIVGGDAVSLSRFPFQAQFFNLGALCSGTVINSWTILTSAHCLDHNKDTLEMRVQAGSRYIYDYSARLYSIETFVIHEKYNVSAQFAYDVALLFLKRPLHLGKYCQKAILANTDKWMNKKEKEFLVTGWGWTKYGGLVSELGLMMTHLSFIPSKTCSMLHKLTITPDMFCLYGEGTRDTCKGDSGGGVLWNGMVVGVTSHGDGCAKKHKPSVYSNVYYFRQWIEQQVEELFDVYCRKDRNETRI